MPRRLGNRAKMTVSGTPGSGTITLGSAVTDATNGDSQTFAASGIQNLDTIRYVVTDGNAWGIEEGLYTTSGTTISARVNLESSTGSLLSLTSAAKVSISWIVQGEMEIWSTHSNNPMAMI